MGKPNRIKIVFAFALLMNLLACKSGPFNLIKPASPHEQYQRKLVTAGLHQTNMGVAWINTSQSVLAKALTINLPYQEKGYFSAEKVEGAAFRFKLTKGQQLKVKLSSKQESGLMIYTDLWAQPLEGSLKWLSSADTLNNTLQFDADQTGNYVLRLQPELLASGAYTLTITTGPSLAYPLKSANRNQIQSLYGVGRDDNSRKHEGIDIFAPFRTPVIAVSAGTVTSVNTNNLGGKVVWFRPAGKNYTLYYAHLDEQTVSAGQTVVYGDTLGRMGNTGNAQTTPPHLHFGIYTNGGAVDPLPFVDPTIKNPEQIRTSTAVLNTTMRTISSASLAGNSLKVGTILRVTAATGNEYRVELPDQQIGYLSGKAVVPVSKALSKYKAKLLQPVFDQPDSAAAVKSNLAIGQTVDVLGVFGDYQLMIDGNQQTGWIKK